MMLNCSVVMNGSEVGIILFQRVAYTLVFILGLILNSSALWCFTRISHWTDTHVYMFNLLIADFVLTIFLPFRIFETFWHMNLTGFCTFLICTHYTNMYASIFTITAISIHRYVVVRFPMKNKTSGTLQARRKKITRVICAFIWLTVITLCITFSEHMYPEKLQTCYERKGCQKMTISFLLVLEILGYLLPIIIITICSAQAISTLQKSLKDIHPHSEDEVIDKRKSIMAIITANMIIFIVCFTPIHAGYLLRYIFAENTKFIPIIYNVTEWLATTNCCLDSVGYYFLLKKVFRDKR